MTKGVNFANVNIRKKVDKNPMTRIVPTVPTRIEHRILTRGLYFSVNNFTALIMKYQTTSAQLEILYFSFKHFYVDGLKQVIVSPFR